MDFEKKFSIGLSDIISLSELDTFLSQYSTYIHDIYFSPPYAKDFGSRNLRNPLQGEEAIESLRKKLDLIHGYNISLKLALNTPFVKSLGVSLENILEKVLNDFGQPNSVTLLEPYVSLISERLPETELVYSYNNNIRTISQLSYIPKTVSGVVIGNSAIRYKSLWKAATTNGFEVELLLNNGCVFGCGGCTSDLRCDKAFVIQSQKFSVEQLFAQQSIFPSEFHTYLKEEENIKYFKISSRPSSLEWLSNCLSSYLSGEEEKYIEQTKRNFLLWSRLALFEPYLDTFNYKRILDYKNLLWEEEFKRA